MLVSRGIFSSRARAKEAIKAGLIQVNRVVISKPAFQVVGTDTVFSSGDVHPYVSRGGMKLEAALHAFEINPVGKVCLDLGASTGGFTDVLIRKDAAKVYAVDVGQGQLHPSLADSRIINLERTHAKDLTVQVVPDPIDLIVCDVSFISLKKALPMTLKLAAPDAVLIALVKPQFEVGSENIGKGGLVKPSYENSDGVVEDIAEWINDMPEWRFLKSIDSPIKGGDGNREFLLAATR